jgi:hypothetical protein
MKHLHHIIPKHAGGTDEPSNLIELTVEEHAREHYLLWNQYGRWQDKVAWKGLYEMIDKQDVIANIRNEMWQSSSHREMFSHIMKQVWKREDYRQRQLQMSNVSQPIATLASTSPESRQKRKKTLQEINHQQGSKNSQFGKMWITNETHSYRINKNESIPEGYRKGRVIKSKT